MFSQTGVNGRGRCCAWLAALAAATLLLATSGSARAHNPDTSYARFEVTRESIDTKFTYDLFSLMRIAPQLDADGDRAVTAAEFEAQVPAVLAYLRSHIQFEIDGKKADFGEPQPVAFPPDSGGAIAEKDYHSAGSLIHFAFHKPLPKPPADFFVDFGIFGELGDRHTVLGAIRHEGQEYPVTFRRFEPDYLYDTFYVPAQPPDAAAAANATNKPESGMPDAAGTSAESAASGVSASPELENSIALSASSSSPSASSGSRRARSASQRSNTNTSPWRQLGNFFRLGVEHIFLGYDHILFLLSLIVVCRFRELLKIVTSFTVAHTITLILATLEVLNPNPRFIEAAIAATIVYVAVENFWIRDTRRRWMLAFGFGLIHGFGFAGVLRELGLPREGLVRCLLSFNVGVETGQLVIVLLLFPLAAGLARWRHGSAAQLAISAAIALCGLGWFVDRAFGLGYMPF